MNTMQSVKTRVQDFSRSLASSAALSHYARTGGECPHCDAVTEWVSRPLQGFYRCETCGKNPLKGTERAPVA